MDALEKLVRRNRIKAQHIAIISCLSLLAFVAIKINSSLSHISTSRNIRINMSPGTAAEIDTSRMKFSDNSKHEDQFSDAIAERFETDRADGNYKEHQHDEDDQNQSNSDLITVGNIDDKQNELNQDKEVEEQKIGNDIAALPSESRDHIEFVSEIPLSLNVRLDLSSMNASQSSPTLPSPMNPSDIEEPTYAALVVGHTPTNTRGESSISEPVPSTKELVVQKVDMNITSGEEEEAIIKEEDTTHLSNVLQDRQNNYTYEGNTTRLDDVLHEKQDNSTDDVGRGNEVNSTASKTLFTPSPMLEESDKDFMVTTNQTEVKKLPSEKLDASETSIKAHSDDIDINPKTFTQKIPANLKEFVQEDDDDNFDDIGVIGDEQQKLDSNEFSQFII